MASTTKLTNEFVSKFNITKVIEQKPKSGQKQVYIVEIDAVLIALKIIPIIDERIKRELKIYDVFKNNDGIPCILNVNEYGDELVIFEEYISGKDLSIIKDQYKNNSKKVRTLIYDIAKVLEPVWNKNYVHRDIKPQNIIIRDEKPVILDFGIARDLDDDTITPTGFQPFSWPFASPEQYFYKREQISYRTDFFCLGILAYHLYTGNYPFGKSKSEIANEFSSEQKSFDVKDKELNNFLNTNLKFRVAERPRTVELFIKSLGI